MPEKITWTNILTGAVLLAALMPFILTYGAFRDSQNYVSEQHLKGGGLVGESSINTGLFISLLVVYALRVMIPFLLYQFMSRRRGQGMLVYAFCASIVFEVVLVIVSFGPAEPTSQGPYDSNGLFGLLAILGVAISIVAQVIGMILGSIIGFGPKPQKVEA